MKKYVKKSASAVLTMVLLATSFTEVYGSDIQNLEATSEIPVTTVTTTVAERDRIFAEAMKSIIPENEINGPEYIYGQELLDYEYVTLDGYAGNQVAGGYNFPTGGGFWFTDSGGPEVSGSVNLGLPAPYDLISVSVNLGKKGTSGLFVDAPNTTDYFKLYITKVMEVRPYIVTRKRAGTDDWEIYNVGSVNVVYSVSASAKKVVPASEVKVD